LIKSSFVLEEFYNEKDMSSIHILESEQQTLKTAKRDVAKRSKKLLVTGLQSMKNNQILEAVQVLHNLHSLPLSIAEITKSSRDNLEQSMRESLAFRTLTESHEPQRKQTGKPPTSIASSTNFRPRLWSALEKVFDSIYIQCTQIENLESVLRRPHEEKLGAKAELYINIFPEEKRNITRDFWLSVTNCLAGYLTKNAGESGFFKQALEGEYPKFLRLYIDLCKRLQNNEKPEGFASPFDMNKKVISPFEKSYLSKSVSMVLDPVHNMFSKEGVPETDEVDTLIRTIRR